VPGFLLAGFQFGNTGVMLSALREITPSRRLGVTMAIMGAGWPVGSALGPALGGLLVDGVGAPLSGVYLLAAALSTAVALVLALGLRDVQPESPPTGRTADLAFGAVRGVFTDPTTRRIFGLYGLVFLAAMMWSPFLPLLVERANDGQAGLASAVALVVGTAALVGGAISPLGGALGDRIGLRRVLVVSLLGSGLAVALMPAAPSVSWLAGASVVRSALSAVAGAMFFGLLATEVPAERRSATLNLVYLPLYLTGVVGPALGALVVAVNLSLVFVLAGALTSLVAVAAARR
jgi:MFS family permease